MKTKKSFLFILFLPFIICGCSDKDVEFELEYKKCPCEHEQEKIAGNFSYENILLFDEAKTSWNQMKEISFDSIYGGSEFMGIDYENNKLRYHNNQDSAWITIRGNICNFPETFNYIPYEGLRISFSGDMFNKCRTSSPSGDIVLTSLKVHTK